MATKVDFKRELRQLYGASREPRLVDVPVLNYLMIDGHGDPNTAVEYRQTVEALYALVHACLRASELAAAGAEDISATALRLFLEGSKPPPTVPPH